MVIEALIAKTPVIASNIGCIPEFIEDGATGLLFETGNAEDLFYKMKLVLENPSLINKFKSNIKPVKTIQEQAKEIEAIYEDLRLRSGSIN